MGLLIGRVAEWMGYIGSTIDNLHRVRIDDKRSGGGEGGGVILLDL